MGCFFVILIFSPEFFLMIDVCEATEKLLFRSVSRKDCLILLTAPRRPNLRHIFAEIQPFETEHHEPDKFVHVIDFSKKFSEFVFHGIFSSPMLESLSVKNCAEWR